VVSLDYSTRRDLLVSGYSNGTISIWNPNISGTQSGIHFTIPSLNESLIINTRFIDSDTILVATESTLYTIEYNVTRWILQKYNFMPESDFSQIIDIQAFGDPLGHFLVVIKRVSTEIIVHVMID
jgi:hypothetical protein